MKILFLQNWFDRTSPDVKYNFNSKMLYFICKSMEKHGAQIQLIAPEIHYDFPNKLRHAFYKYIVNQYHLRSSDLSLLKREARIRSKIINNLDADAVFAFSNHALAFLETNKIMSYWSDTCFALQRTGNPYYTNITKLTLKSSNIREQKALDKIDAGFLTSNWARKATYNNFNIDKNKLFVAPLGPDLEIKHDFSSVEKFIETRINKNTCKLLVIGWDYINKGINTAIAIVKRLNEMKFDTEVMILGYKIDDNLVTDKIHNIKFLNKNNPVEYNEFCKYLEDTHFLLAPTLFDCTPHTICEANAFGVPAIATNVGGIPEMITDNVNGKTFNIGENIENYCNYIIDTYTNKTKYREMCVNSYNVYNTKLNWDYGTKIIIDKLKEIKTTRFTL